MNLANLALAAPLLILAQGKDEPAPAPLEPAHHGAAVDGAGDVDQDGCSDVVIGTWWDDSNRGHGSATVYSGKTGQRLYTTRGDQEGAGFGVVVAGGGDTDGDGRPDIFVGAPDTKVKGKRTGSAFVVSGKDGKTLLRLDGASEGDRFGAALAFAGDVNQDGFTDLVVGIPGATGRKGELLGAARVYSGKDGKQLLEWKGEVPGGRFGSSVDGAGDCDGDGSSDVVVGAWSAGIVHVYSGRNGKVLHAFAGPKEGGRFGWCVRGAGDTNQKGFSNVFVGLPTSATEAAHLYDGKTGDRIFTASRAMDEGREAWSLGAAVNGAGDVNADGFTDLVIGDPGYPLLLRDATGEGLGPVLMTARKKLARPGTVVVFSGQDGRELHRFAGDKPDDFLGVCVASAGDVDQDGCADIIAGAGRDAPYHARIWSGKTGALLRSLVVEK